MRASKANRQMYLYLIGYKIRLPGIILYLIGYNLYL